MLAHEAPGGARLAILAFSCGLLALGLAGCAPTPDLSSADGRQQILDEVNALLNSMDCTAAVEAITPLYDSQYSDNAVRMAAASAYGCDARIDFLSLAYSIGQDSAQLSTGPGFWELMAQLFPSKQGQDYVVEGALSATGALQSALNPGAIVLPSYQIDPGTYNVGSPYIADRISDANLYLLFVSMAAIGGLENRFGGTPSSSNSYQKTQDLPWETATAVDANGCAMASSVLNLVDSLTAVQSLLPTSAQSSMSQILSVFEGPLDPLAEACDIGCQGLTPPVDPVLNPSGTWVASGCSFPAGTCNPCPIKLRDRGSCTSSTSDEQSCAAAGLINLINVSAIGWP